MTPIFQMRKQRLREVESFAKATRQIGSRGEIEPGLLLVSISTFPLPHHTVCRFRGCLQGWCLGV